MHYLKNVLRFKVGDYLRIFNAQDGEYLAQLIQVHKSYLSLQAVKLLCLAAANVARPLTLAMCIIKQDKFLEAINAAVQLGITKIIPIISARVQRPNISLPKINKVIMQAVEQSERFALPVCQTPMQLSTLLSDVRQQIIFACERLQPSMHNFKLSNNQELTILIGPEGGFTEAEIEQINAHPNVLPLSLSDGVLRAETAAVVAIANIQSRQLYEFGD